MNESAAKQIFWRANDSNHWVGWITFTIIITTACCASRNDTCVTFNKKLTRPLKFTFEPHWSHKL